MWWMDGGFQPSVPHVDPPSRNVAKGYAAVGFVAWAAVVLLCVGGLAFLLRATAWEGPLLGWLLLIVVLWVCGVIAVRARAYSYFAAAQERQRIAAAVGLASRSDPTQWANGDYTAPAAAVLIAGQPAGARSTPEITMCPPAPNTPRTATDQSFAAEHFDAAAGVEYRDQILHHLIERYLTGDTFPYGTPNRFTVAQFHRLFRYVVQEGYGE